MDSLESPSAEGRAFAEERDWGRFHTTKNLAMAVAGELVAELQCWVTVRSRLGSTRWANYGAN
jgi:hypothetical protein